MKHTLSTRISRTLVVLTGCFLASNASGAALCVGGPGCYSTIQAAINAAAPSDTISIAAGTFFENLMITSSVSLVGQGAGATVIDGGHAARVITIVSTPASTVKISNVTVQHGQALHGGGIANGDSGVGNQGATLTISGSVITANRAGFGGGGGSNQLGGGIYTNSPLTLTNSTVSNNLSNGDGGGIKIAGPVVTITNSTISGNANGDTECCGWGGGISNEGTLTLLNSTLSGNTSYGGEAGAIGNSGLVTLSFTSLISNVGSTITNYGAPIIFKNSIVVHDSYGYECLGPVTSLGGNFNTVGTCGGTPVTQASLNLGPLQVNAPGTTATHALLTPSVAINAAVTCKDAGGVAVTTDQRGSARPAGAGCDSGAFEYQPPSIASVTATVQGLLGTLDAGTVNSLLSKLSAAQDAVARGNKNAAANQLGALSNQVDALVHSHRLDAATGNALNAAIQQVIATL